MTFVEYENEFKPEHLERWKKNKQIKQLMKEANSIKDFDKVLQRLETVHR